MRLHHLTVLLLPLALAACATGPAGAPSAGRQGVSLGGSSLLNRVARQVTLTKARFSPGEIDGRDTILSRRAAERYLALRGGQEVPEAPAPLTTYTVRAQDAKYVGELGATKEEQAKMKFLPYESLLELVAERYRCSQGLLTELNGLPANARLKVGDTVRVPNVEPLEIERVGPRAVRGGSRANRVRIVVDQGILEVSAPDGRLLAFFPVSCGNPSTPTPRGDWKLVNMVTLPNFRWDEEMLQRGVRSADFFLFPPGPNNPVGIFWAGTSKTGVGIHGNPLPHTISTGRSHGCIRLTNWDALEFGRLVAVGSPVRIE
ncbi:MAG: L,D-transpeptidase family protein [Verrucomicrobia bacterium]|nr:L,D-transpeptidase family protein [Verrucomicrobiota bacterium]